MQTSIVLYEFDLQDGQPPIRLNAVDWTSLRAYADAKKKTGPCGKGWAGEHPNCKRAEKKVKSASSKSRNQSPRGSKSPGEAEKGKAARKPASKSAKARPQPAGIAEIEPSQLAVDPKRFQYKIIGEHTASGEVGSLSGVRRYDPNLAGILQVWHDPIDGQDYVVNGHNRLALAKRLGADKVAVRYLDAPDAKSARAIGALTNIAEGRGDGLDAAKFFRDTGISKADLERKGIPMRERIAQEGLAMAGLDDSLFRRAIDGDITINRASIIGGSGLDHAQQRDLAKLIDSQGKRRNLTDAAIQEMVDIAKSASTTTEITLSLFGEEEVQKTNMIEKAKLQAAVKKRLSREKNLFGTVSKSRAAEDLTRAGNQIDVAQSSAISDKARQALLTFDQLKSLAGPVSSAINSAADRIANGESQKQVERDLYEQILKIDLITGRERRSA